MLTVHDLDATVAEITWARENGMKGVIIPTVPGDGLPPYYDQCYDQMWAACQDLEMPVHIHGGSGTPNYGDYGAVEHAHLRDRDRVLRAPAAVVPDLGRRARAVPAHEAGVHRVALRIGSRARSPTSTRIYSQRFFSHIRETVKLKPSEYWERQCYVAASFMGPDESAMRHDIGLDKLMWGADYPHVEGTWPRTRKSLARCFHGIPTDEVRTILTDNPARLYGFDVDALQPVADRVCPTIQELTGVG